MAQSAPQLCRPLYPRHAGDDGLSPRQRADLHPAYLHFLSGSDLIVSLGASLQQLGGVISPIAGAAQIEHRKKILPVSMFSAP
ncbi:MAG: hypothetical protein WDM81_04270 [Rhizomicrobium sp.]